MSFGAFNLLLLIWVVVMMAAFASGFFVARRWVSNGWAVAALGLVLGGVFAFAAGTACIAGCTALTGGINIH